MEKNSIDLKCNELPNFHVDSAKFSAVKLKSSLRSTQTTLLLISLKK